ncbi:MAG: PAS domain-containing protein [Bacteroidales bacterium]|nr:PAS domain-containing protein [Bacteroidales bacterium]
MFKSVQYKLFLYTLLLIITVAGLTYLIVAKEYIYAVPVGAFMIFVLNMLRLHYRKYNDNIIFLLNALENGDYSFRFSSTKLSVREKEFNMMLNRIKEILTTARKEVIENEKFLSLIIESVSTGIIIMDDYGHIETVNQVALDLLGLPVFTHVNQLSGISQDLPQMFLNMKPGDNLQISVTNERENNQISLRLSKVTIRKRTVKVITLNNIGSELEAKEMESWIRLIRVMTHEIMNSIAPITSLSETMTNVLKPVNKDRNDENLENTIIAFETINTTARGLLSFVESYRKFTRIPSPEKRNITILPFVRNIINLENNLLNQYNIDVDVKINNENSIIYVDLSLFSQIFVNIIKNAIEAVCCEEERKIYINIQSIEGLKTIIDISNTGKPIPEEVLPHIFVPFFTTKNTGTGIGLSISRYIMRLHGGKLNHFTSEKGLTTFRIVL